MSDFPGGKIHIRRRLDGAVRIEFGREIILVSPDNAIRLAQALIKESGVGEVVMRPTHKVFS